MLTKHGGEDDRVDAIDFHTGGVSKLDEALDTRVKLGKELPSTSHMVGGAGVKAPPASLVIVGAVAKELRQVSSCGLC
jgi:hypothetical protein